MQLCCVLSLAELFEPTPLAQISFWLTFTSVFFKHFVLSKDMIILLSEYNDGMSEMMLVIPANSKANQFCPL